MSMSDHLPHPTILMPQKFNISSKRTAQANNMRAKLQVEYTRHQLLKG